ncbi:MAG: hypothetical protein ABR974_12520 [Bacteroidales bacterium]|jgi:hypothetical protein
MILIDETVFYNTYSEQLTVDRSKQLFENLKNLSWISYAFFPIILCMKFIFITIVLYTGIFFYNLHDKIRFSAVLKVVIASDGIFILAGLMKIFWFSFFAGNYNLNDLGFFYPLSLINLFRISEVDKIWIHPLQVINVFQIIYFFALSFGLKNICCISRAESEKIVSSTYFPALAIWIAFIMFISIDTVV